MKTVLSLDVATVTGWSFGPAEVGARPSSGSLRFGEKGADDSRIWAKALIWLTEQIGVLRPDVVYIEAPINSASPAGGSNAATLGRLIGLQAVLRTVVELKLPVSAKLAHVQSARKFFINAGNLPGAVAKERVQRRCLQLGWLTVENMDPDRADALCVWAFAAAQESAEFATSMRFPGAQRRRAA